MLGSPLAMIRNTADGLVSGHVTLDHEGCQRVIASHAALRDRLARLTEAINNVVEDMASGASNQAMTDYLNRVLRNE